MSLLSLRNVSFTWGGLPLLDQVDLEIAKGERIGLMGRNGTGKTTLMKIIAGEIPIDDGEIRNEKDVRVAHMKQEVPTGVDGTVADWIRHYCEEQSVGDETDEDGHSAEWKLDHAIDRVTTQMKVDPDAVFSTLSSGMKRRALLAGILVHEPDILLLDEPTNHLDIESIDWLERFLRGYKGTLVFVTHDRVFLQTLATRIIEIDRGRLFDWSCDYDTFLKRKQDMLAAEEKQNAAFDRKLAEEEVWIRKGIKARRTRNEGRVRALERMREERRQRRQRMGNVRMQTGEAEKSGRLVIEAKQICFRYDEAPIVDGLSLHITRGDKIGIVGPNGTGKTTLLKLLLGDLEPDSGTVRHGTRLEVIYFDQLREQIDENATVVECVGEGQDTLVINGKQQHIYGYLQNFLFTPERARRATKFLSGGERNRLLLARLFKRPSNVMVLDEPTNDLDLETLELLEELVSDYQGTLLIVSHDRSFLNNVVTSTLAFEGGGQIKEYDGGYDDYMRQRQEATQQEATAKKRKEPANTSSSTKSSAPAKLSYQERRELESLPLKIEEMEREHAELCAAMADGEFFKQDGTKIASETARLETLEGELKELYSRWEDLESRS